MTGLFLLVLIAGLGRLLRAPGRLVMGMLGILWASFVLVHVLFPDPVHPIPALIGGSLAGWIGLGVVAAIIAPYRWALQRLRARAVTPETRPGAETTGPFSKAELARYSRHILLREIGGTGQRRLKEARVLVIGAGGLGSPVLLYLAAAGVGTLGVIDDDEVSVSNLQRQVLFRDADLGRPKVFAAEAALKALNPHLTIRPYHRRFTPEIAADLIADYDLILDGCDDFATRLAVNAACVAAQKPLLSGAISQWEGQIGLYHPAKGGPCMACLFPKAPAPGLAPTCAEGGVMAALPGIIGTMLAAEAIKHLTGAGQGLRGKLILHDALYGESRSIAVKAAADCPVCAASAGQPPASGIA